MVAEIPQVEEKSAQNDQAGDTRVPNLLDLLDERKETSGEQDTSDNGGSAGRIVRDAPIEETANTEKAPDSPAEPDIANTEQSNDSAAPSQTERDKLALQPELLKELEEAMEEQRKYLEANNFEIDFKRGEGPWNAITRARTEAQAKAASGAELSPQEKAFANVSHEQVLSEARRMRDRDFQELKDNNGNPRNWYIVGEKSTRWNQSEIEEMMKSHEAELVKQLTAKQTDMQKEREEKERQEAQAREEETFFDRKFNEIPEIATEPTSESESNLFDERYNRIPNTAEPEDLQNVETNESSPIAVDTDSNLPRLSLEEQETEQQEVDKEINERIETGANEGSKLGQFPSAYLAYKAFASADLAKETWMPANDAQALLANQLADGAIREQAERIPSEIMDAKASIGDIRPVNEFLKSKGLTMELNPIGGNDVAFAATLNLSGAWDGRASTISKDGADYPAVFLRRESYQVGDQVVVKLYEKDGVKVFATPMEENLNGAESLARAGELTPGDAHERTHYRSARVPMISLAETTDLDELVGMSSREGSTIREAKMETRLSLDENGFDVKQGFAAAATRSAGLGGETFDIDKPFLLWATYENGSQPLFALRLDESRWKDPKQ